MRSESKINRTYIIVLIFTLCLLTTQKACVSIQKTTMYKPFFEYVIDVQAQALPTKNNEPINFVPKTHTEYKYKTDEVLNYIQSESGNLIYITKPMHLYQDDIDNLNSVCTNKQEPDTFYEVLPDGKIIRYKLHKTTSDYTIEVNITNER